MRRKKVLTEFDRQAINCLMRGMSKTASLIKAGWHYKYANARCTDYFRQDHIAAEVQKRRKLMAKRADIDADWITQRLMAIIEMDVAQLLEQDENGDVCPVPIHKLSPSLRKALSVTITGKRVKITQEDRLKALDQLAKLSGLYEDKITIEAGELLTQKLLEGRKRASLRNQEDEDG